MDITLIVLGVGLALAAILGGGIQVGNISIPAIPSLSGRILVGFLGVVVFYIGLSIYLPPERPTPTDPEPTDPPKTPKPTTTLAGTVGLSHHVAAFSERHADYLITASSPSTSEHSANLDPQGTVSHSRHSPSGILQDILGRDRTERVRHLAIGS